MNKFFILLVFGAGFLFITAGCKKEKLPETITINGMTFGCRVDGKPFIPDKWDYGNNIPPIRIEFYFDPLTRTVFLKTIAEKQNTFVEIYINSPLMPGRKELKFNTRPFPTYANPKDYGLYYVHFPESEYITNATIGGYVDLIEVDTSTNKVFARFEFTGTDRLTGNQVKVTNGVFRNF